jgi:hypothetical protein
MNVRMKQQILTPTMQDAEETYVRPQVRGVSGDCSKGLGCRAEENVVDHPFILVSDGGNLLGNGEDDVKVFGVEEFFLSIFQPLGACERLTCWATPRPATVVPNTLMATAIAPLNMSAKSRGAAQFDRRHRAALRRRERNATLLTVSSAVAAEHVRHF